MTTTIPGGLLIAIEGIDGAGKTTLAHSLRARLEATRAAVTVSKEPTTGHWGAQLRASAATGRLKPEEELRMLLLDRREHVAEVIGPALAAGGIVILDRYFPSTVAYQGAAGLPVDGLMAVNAFAPRPDVLLVLDLAPEEGLARIRARGDRPNMFETPANLAACRAIFLEMAVPNTRVIDATQPPDAVLDEAHAHVVIAISRKLAAAHGGTPAGVEAMMPFVAGLA